MSLIKCPECGRENVSDSAVACPNCGYGIKAHFERIRAEEAKAKLEEERKRRAEELKASEEERQKKRLESVKKPEKPVFSRLLIIYMVATFIIITLMFFYEATTWFIEICIFIVLPFIIYYSSYQKRVDKYKLSLENFEEYQELIIKEKDEEAERAFRESQKQLENVIRCPHCNSTNTKRISTASRAVSIGTVGLASGKIGKQYMCKDCKHMW